MNPSPTPILHRIWNLCCSLKLAIVLASTATILVMGGSIVMHFNPRVFGGMDSMILSDWYTSFGRPNLRLAWWLPLAGLCTFLLGLNTLCCFIDWAYRFRSRWRKTGEYLLHLGFVLVVIAFIAGSVSGFRTGGDALFTGQGLPIEEMPEYTVRLDALEPVIDDRGRPIEMLSTVALIKGSDVVERQVVKTNTPLLHNGLAILASSFGRITEGFRIAFPGGATAEMRKGTSLPLSGGRTLRVINYFPTAQRLPNGHVAHRGNELQYPAFELRVSDATGTVWQGWYFLKESLPFPLIEAGARFWPTEPLYRIYVVLTVTRDPGAGLALIGSILMMVGVTFAMFSFYAKRKRGDRPDIA